MYDKPVEPFSPAAVSQARKWLPSTGRLSISKNGGYAGKDSILILTGSLIFPCFIEGIAPAVILYD
jgi:hypothetical protein